jgi:hypothetical protein
MNIFQNLNKIQKCEQFSNLNKNTNSERKRKTEKRKRKKKKRRKKEKRRKIKKIADQHGPAQMRPGAQRVRGAGRNALLTGGK